MAITYPAPAGLPASPDFQVEADGQPVFVYNPAVRVNRGPGSFMGVAIFDFEGAVTVTVTSKAPLDKLVVRPKALGLKPVVTGNKATFTLTRPCKFTVEPDGVEANALAVFAGAPLTGQPKPGDDQVLYFGPGVHDAGAIQLRSGWTYYLAGGAYVRGHLQGEHLKDVKIRGRGILDRVAPELYKAQGVPPLRENATYMPADGIVKPHFIALAACRDVLVEGITLFGGIGWGVVPWRCEDLVFRDMNLVADGANSDGIDLVGCRRVLMEGLFIRNWDDCVVLKGRDFHGREDCTDITVQRSVFWVDLAQGLEIGFECECGRIARVRWRDIDIIHMHHNSPISIHNASAALVEDISYENIRIEDLDPARFRPDQRKDLASGSMRLFDLWIGETPGWSKEGGQGRIRNIRFKDIRVTTVGGRIPPSRVAGADAEHTIEDVVFDNLTINGRRITEAGQAGFVIDPATAQGVRFA